MHTLEARRQTFLRQALSFLRPCEESIVEAAKRSPRAWAAMTRDPPPLLKASGRLPFTITVPIQAGAALAVYLWISSLHDQEFGAAFFACCIFILTRPFLNTLRYDPRCLLWGAYQLAVMCTVYAVVQHFAVERDHVLPQQGSGQPSAILGMAAAFVATLLLRWLLRLLRWISQQARKRGVGAQKQRLEREGVGSARRH
jgi:hypothetical protein